MDAVTEAGGEGAAHEASESPAEEKKEEAGEKSESEEDKEASVIKKAHALAVAAVKAASAKK